MTQIIAIANQKGGVGKTTTVVNLGFALTQMKKKLLLVDLDPQSDLTDGLGINSDELEDTIYTALLEDDVPIDTVIYPVYPYLDVIPSTTDLAAAEIELVPEIRRELILKRILSPLDLRYDYILIDCPPNLSLLTINALCASQGVIIPLQCEHFAIRGIHTLIDSIKKTNAHLNPNLRLLGILPTMYSTGTVHSRELLERAKSVFGDKIFDVVIYKSIRFADASLAQKSIVEYDARHKGAEAYLKLAEIIVKQTANRQS